MADVAVQPVIEQTAPPPPRWSLAHRMVFRFVFCYWVMYMLPERGRVAVISSIPGTQFLFQPWVKMWHAFVPWVATTVFHITGRAATYFMTGSGDTTLQYISNLLYVVIALVAAAIWSALDRRRGNYRRLEGWLRLFVRYTLAFTLFGYGFAKVFPLQFRPPSFGKLLEPWGDFSPMGALWSFMGASVPYIIFSGAAEVTGGLLLLFRRTATLGAMVSFVVLMNVAALNYCYDVPVKLYSTNLVLMAVYLASPDFERLLNLLVLNRATQPAQFLEPAFQRRALRIAVTAFWALYVGYNLYGHITGGWQAYKSTYRNAKNSPIYGLFDVESGPADWKKLAASFPSFIEVRTKDDQSRMMQVQYTGDIVMVNKRDQLTISRPDGDHVVLTGQWKGEPTAIRLRRVDTSKMLLLSRGFHWINEMPFNR